MLINLNNLILTKMRKVMNINRKKNKNVLKRRRRKRILQECFIEKLSNFVNTQTNQNYSSNNEETKGY